MKKPTPNDSTSQDKGKRNNHGRTYGKNPSHPLPVWNGILEHCQKIGPAIWEFLWLIDKITVEDERGIGWCLGSTPIDAQRIADDLGRHLNTVYENLERLATEPYIVRKRTPRGYAIGVVNSRKFEAFRSKSDRQAVENQAGDSEKNLNHPGESDPQKTVDHSQGDPQKTGTVIHSFPGCDPQKTVNRRDTTRHYKETLQADVALSGDSFGDRPSSSSYSDPQKSMDHDDDDACGKLNPHDNPKLQEWARQRILSRAHNVNDPQAYLYTALPKFFENLAVEVESYLVDRLNQYVDTCMWNAPALPMGFQEWKNFLEMIVEQHQLPIDPNDLGLTDRTFAAVANEERHKDSLILAEPFGYVTTEKWQTFRLNDKKYPVKGWTPDRTKVATWQFLPAAKPN